MLDQPGRNHNSGRQLQAAPPLWLTEGAGCPHGPEGQPIGHHAQCQVWPGRPKGQPSALRAGPSSRPKYLIVLCLAPSHMGKGLSLCIGGPHKVGAKSFPPAIFPEVGRAGGCGIG